MEVPGSSSCTRFVPLLLYKVVTTLWLQELFTSTSFRRLAPSLAVEGVLAAPLVAEGLRLPLLRLHQQQETGPTFRYRKFTRPLAAWFGTPLVLYELLW